MVQVFIMTIRMLMNLTMVHAMEDDWREIPVAVASQQVPKAFLRFDGTRVVGIIMNSVHRRGVEPLRNQGSPVRLMVSCNRRHRRKELRALGSDLPCTHTSHGATREVSSPVVKPLQALESLYQLDNPPTWNVAP